MPPKSRTSPPSPTEVYGSGRATPRNQVQQWQNVLTNAGATYSSEYGVSYVSYFPINPATGQRYTQIDPTTNQPSEVPAQGVVVLNDQNEVEILRLDQAIEQFKKQFPDIRSTKTQLYRSNYFSSESAYLDSINRPGWDGESTAALQKMLNDISVTNFDALRNAAPNTTPQLFSFRSYLATGVGPTSTRTGAQAPLDTYQLAMTDKQSSDLIKNTMVSLIGRAPTKKEITQFTKELNEALKKEPRRVKRVGTRQIEQEGINPTEFANEYVLSKFVNPAFKENPSTEFGGQLGEIRRQIKDYAVNMGLSISDAALNNRVLKVVNQKMTAQDQITRLRNLAMEQYKPFAQRLQEDEDLTVRELANPYIQLMADTLEIDADFISLTDKNIQDALLGEDGMTPTNLRDFRRKLRKDPRFDYTMQAGQEAAAVAKGLLQAFGYGV